MLYPQKAAFFRFSRTPFRFQVKTLRRIYVGIIFTSAGINKLGSIVKNRRKKSLLQGMMEGYWIYSVFADFAVKTS